MITATGLALLAALLVAASAVAQQTAAASVTARGAGFFGALVRRRRWLVGVACDTAGFVAQLVARAFGPLLLVQPVLATSVLFALVLAAAARRVGPQGWDSLRAPTLRAHSVRVELPAGVVLVLGLAVFIALGRPTRGATRVPVASWVPALVVVGVLAGAAVALARRTRAASVRAVALAAVTALAYGLGAALSTTVVALVADGVGAVVTAWETWAAALVLLAGTACQQLAYRAGPLALSLPVVAAGEPVVAVLLGVTVFSERLRLDGPWVAAAVVAMVVAVVVLARGAREPAPSGLRR